MLSRLSNLGTKQATKLAEIGSVRTRARLPPTVKLVFSMIADISSAKILDGSSTWLMARLTIGDLLINPLRNFFFADATGWVGELLTDRHVSGSNPDICIQRKPSELIRGLSLFRHETYHGEAKPQTPTLIFGVIISTDRRPRT